eukprot:scaffold70910_cov69-Phaeocystis_antarctica.AAC.7
MSQGTGCPGCRQTPCPSSGAPAAAAGSPRRGRACCQPAGRSRARRKAPCSPTNDQGDARRATGEIGARRWWARAHQQLVDVLTGVFVDLLKPALDVVERVEVRDVVHDDDAVSAAVVGAADGAEPLLARSVPNLELDRFARKGYRVSAKPAFPRALGLSKEGGAAHEIDADRTDVAVGPLVVLRRQRTRASAPEQQSAWRSHFSRQAKAHRKAQEQARLADARVTD